MVENIKPKQKSKILLSGLPNRHLALGILETLRDDPDLEIADFAFTESNAYGGYTKIGGREIYFVAPNERFTFGFPYRVIAIDDSSPEMVMKNVSYYCQNQIPMVVANNGGHFVDIKKEVETSIEDHNKSVNSRIINHPKRSILFSNSAPISEIKLNGLSAVLGRSMAIQAGALLNLLGDMVGFCEGQDIFSPQDSLDIIESHPDNGLHISSVTKGMIKSFEGMGMRHYNTKQLRINSSQHEHHKYASYYYKLSSTNSKSRGLRDFCKICEYFIRTSPSLSDFVDFHDKGDKGLSRQTVDTTCKIGIHRPTPGRDDFTLFLSTVGYGPDISGAIACARFLSHKTDFGTTGICDINDVIKFNEKINKTKRY